jgi:hypothetical protein
VNPKFWKHDDPNEEPPSPHKTAWAIGIGLTIGVGILYMILEPLLSQRTLPTSTPSHRGILISPIESGKAPLDKEKASDFMIDAIIQIESQGNPTMVGGIGERGLMQIRESTWDHVTQKHFGQTISFDRAFEPALNRQIGRYYLGDLQAYLYKNQSKWKSDLRSLLLASYNAGPERVRASGFDLSRLPQKVQSYASRGSALHDWYLEEESEKLHQMLIEAGKTK